MSKTLLLDQYMGNLDSGMLEGLMPAELELTEAEIGRVKSLALKRVRQPKRARAGKKRVALLIAAVVGMMAAAAAGAANLAGEELFGRYFGGGLQPGWLEKMCSTSQASARADGYQVDLLGVMGSRYGVNLIFDLTAPEGAVLSDTVRFESSQLLLEGQGGFSAGWRVAQIADDDPSDNKARFLLIADTDQKLAGREMTLQLERLQQTSETPKSGGYTESVLSDSEWVLTFPLDYQDTARTIFVGEKVVWKGEKVTLRTVELSPVGLWLNFGPSISSLWEGQPAPPVGEGAAEIEQASPILHMADGSLLTIEEISLMSGESRNFSRFSAGWNFGVLVDITQVESIEVMGVEIPVG